MPDNRHAAQPPAAASQERLLWEGSEGQVANAGAYVWCLLFGWLAVPLLIALYRCLLTMSHRYTVSDQRLRESTGILFRQTEELELYRVKDITVQLPLLYRILGRGRVILQTSDRSTPVVVLNAIEDPYAVADMLRHCVEQCRAAKGVREID